MNIQRNEPSDDKRKRVALYVTDCLEQLAIALKVVLPATRQALFLHALGDLMIPQIEYGFDQALKRFIPGYGMDFPAPGMLRDYCLEWRDTGVPEALTRPAKPADWEPGLAGELIAAMRKKSQAGPKYRDIAEEQAHQRNNISEIPTDPDERRRWASQTAKERGWRA